MRKTNTYRAMQGIIKHETQAAILLQLHCPENKKLHTNPVWFPLSQIASIHRCYNVEDGTFDVLMVSEWLLGQKGMLEVSLKENPATNKEVIKALDDPTFNPDTDIPF